MLSATLPVAASRPAADPPRSLPAAGPPVASTPVASPPVARPSVASSTGASRPVAAPAPSTQLRIETALSLVVVEFRSPDGEMRQSIPTPREIDAYRNPPLPSPDPKLDLNG